MSSFHLQLYPMRFIYDITIIISYLISTGWILSQSLNAVIIITIFIIISIIIAIIITIIILIIILTIITFLTSFPNIQLSIHPSLHCLFIHPSLNCLFIHLSIHALLNYPSAAFVCSSFLLRCIPDFSEAVKSNKLAPNPTMAINLNGIMSHHDPCLMKAFWPRLDFHEFELKEDKCRMF